MKKSIGLTANISEFRPNLPQTKHLNYFMGTNPVYMAGGGDVKAGIPNYPDVNVTRGFLPAALGFAPGGEADKDAVTKIYDFIFGYFKNVFGLDDDEAQKKTEETIQDPEKVQEIITQIPIGKSPSFDDIETGKFEGMPPSTLTPKDTVTTTPTGPSFDDISTGKFEGMPPGMATTTPVVPKTDREIDIETGKFEGMPPGIVPDGGITGIPQEIFDKEEEIKGLETPRKEYKWLDLNKDGVIDGKDLEIARNNPIYGWAIKLIEGIIGGFDDSKPDEKPLEKDIVVPEGLPPSHPEFPGKKPISPKIKTDKDIDIETGKFSGIPPSDITGGGITRIDTDYPGRGLTTTEDEALGEDEQKLFKATTGDTKGKKDVPAWALPLMSAGFAMMASKSPYFMQALGEGGQKGLETYTGMKEAELTGRKTEAEIKKAEAMAEWYSGGGAGGKPTIINDSETGRRVYAIFNKKTNQYDIIKKADNTPLYAVRSNEEIDEYLSGIHLTWATMPEDEKNKYRQQEKDRDLGVALTNVASGTDEDKGPGFGSKIWKGLVEGVTKEKDGGIVSLRR